MPGHDRSQVAPLECQADGEGHAVASRIGNVGRGHGAIEGRHGTPDARGEKARKGRRTAGIPVGIEHVSRQDGARPSRGVGARGTDRLRAVVEGLERFPAQIDIETAVARQSHARHLRDRQVLGGEGLHLAPVDQGHRPVEHVGGRVLVVADRCDETDAVVRRTPFVRRRRRSDDDRMTPFSGGIGAAGGAGIGPVPVDGHDAVRSGARLRLALSARGLLSGEAAQDGGLAGLDLGISQGVREPDQGRFRKPRPERVEGVPDRHRLAAGGPRGRREESQRRGTTGDEPREGEGEKPGSG